MDSPKELIVTKQWSVTRIIFLMVLVLGIGVTVVGIYKLRDIRGKAKTVIVNPSPLPVEVVLPSETELTPPYVRLAKHKTTYGFSEDVPIDVYLDTAGNPSTELSIVVTYDDNLLEISDTNIQSSDVYRSIDLTSIEAGKIQFSLFINPQVGHKLVSAEKEMKVATLLFKTRTLEKDEVKIELDFEKGDTDKTSLIAFSETREESPENILESVEGVSLSIAP